MNYYIDLDENGVLIHNILLLFPKNSHLVITRKLCKGLIGSVFIQTNCQTSSPSIWSAWNEMAIDDSLFAYRYDMDLNNSGAFAFVTSFHPYTTSKQEDYQKGPYIRFVVQNDIYINGKLIGNSGLCIQSMISNCLGNFTNWNSILYDSFICGYNCIHLTPLQCKGSSHSCFSITNFLDIDSQFLVSDPIYQTHSILLDEYLSKTQFISKEGKDHYSQLYSYLQYYREKYHFLFITDIVLNHISFDNISLHHHHDISYNNTNTPQLIPAIRLDLIIQYISYQLEKEHFFITTNSHIDTIIKRIEYELWNTLHFDEYWLLDIDRFINLVSSHYSILSYCSTEEYSFTDEDMKQIISNAIIETRIGQRFPLSVDLNIIKQSITSQFIYHCQIERVIQSINEDIREQVVIPQIQMILSSIWNTIHYRFIENKAKIPIVPIPSASYPLVEFYFTNCSLDHQSSQDKMYFHLSHADDEYFNSFFCYCANNGWTWDNTRDPMNEHVNPLKPGLFQDNKIRDYMINTKYLKREVIIWSDCVKLRYYNEHKQETWIYHVMQEYINICAFLFDGFRLDNCHNTSLSLLQNILPSAHSINHNLILLAELFTQDQAIDKEYISTLGIDMIVRETACNANHYKEIKHYSDLLYSVGGEEFGSLRSIKEIPCYEVNTKLPTVLYDMTHDNQSFNQLYELPSIPAVTVLNGMAVTHTASTKGFDEGYIVNPNVTEERQYDTDVKSHFDDNRDILTLREYMINGKQPYELKGNCYLRLLMNNLHQLLSKNQFSERYVHYYPSTSIISIERRCTGSSYSVLCITNTAFTSCPQKEYDIPIVGQIMGLFISVHCNEDCYTINKKEEEILFTNEKTLKGCSFSYDLKTSTMHNFCSISSSSTESTLHLTSSFTQGSSIVLLIYNGNEIIFNHLLNYSECCNLIDSSSASSISSLSHPYEVINELQNYLTLNTLSYSDLSYLLFTSDQEQVAINGWNMFVIPSNSSIIQTLDSFTNSYYQHHNHYATESLTYAGLFGIIPSIRQIVKYNQLNHPLLDSLRQGNWLLDYQINRLNMVPSLQYVQQLLLKEFKYIETCSKSSRPVKFCRFMVVLGDLMEKYIVQRMKLPLSEAILALASLQFTIRLPEDSITFITAGHPHFSSGIMRKWGRDTFISFDGILLKTRRFSEARALLLEYGSLIRHGLICNLYGEKHHARYNSRDATWWWLYSIEQYIANTKDIAVLNERITFYYNEEGKKINLSLQETIQWVLTKVGEGIIFTEWNAPSIDEHMTEEGFHMHIYIDEETGFVMGGNKYNCGTWMDKMGSYDDGTHSNKGIPASPRYGAAIEIIALQARIIHWLATLNHNGDYKSVGCFVKVGNKLEFWKYEDWFKRIQSHIECCYYYKNSQNEWYYKDCYNYEQIEEDKQLRPNYMIALAIFPELFNKDHAHQAIQTGIQALFHDPYQLGVKTLSPFDNHYRCYYDNAMQYTNDIEVCNGWSYHNGPEWIWLTGFMIQALLNFPPQSVIVDGHINKHYLKQLCMGLLKELMEYIHEDDWYSLPELSNHNGEYNSYACRAQAWSIASTLSAFDSVLHMSV